MQTAVRPPRLRPTAIATPSSSRAHGIMLILLLRSKARTTGVRQLSGRYTQASTLARMAPRNSDAATSSAPPAIRTPDSSAYRRSTIAERFGDELHHGVAGEILMLVERLVVVEARLWNKIVGQAGVEIGAHARLQHHRLVHFLAWPAHVPVDEHGGG